MTLFSAPAAGSASKAEVNLECVKAGPSIQAQGSARDVAPALGAPSNAISNPNLKQTQHRNNRRFYPDLLHAACHYCDHLPRDTQLQVIITWFPINSDGRITVPESEADILLHDLDKKRAPKGLPRKRGRGKLTVSTGAAYLDRLTLALLRDAFDQDEARKAWESELNIFRGTPEQGSVDVMELRETAQDILLQRSTDDKHAAPEWQEALVVECPTGPPGRLSHGHGRN